MNPIHKLTISFSIACVLLAASIGISTADDAVPGQGSPPSLTQVAAHAGDMRANRVLRARAMAAKQRGMPGTETAPMVVGLGLSGMNGHSLTDAGTRLAPNDPGGQDFFGSNVAVQGDLAVVGAFNADNSLGAAYVYRRESGIWVQRTKLVAEDRSADSEFGENVKISGDRIAIGAPGDRNGIGAVYIFRRTGNTWTQEAKLTANDPAENSFFADSIAFNHDMLISGADGASAPGAAFAGAAYVFRRNGASWTQEAKLVANDPSVGAAFGLGTAIVDQDTLAIGASGAQASGAVYLFQRRRGAWFQQSRLLPSSPEQGQFFGGNLDVSGNSLVVGAQFAATAGDIRTGAAYVYRRAGDLWTEEARLVPTETQARSFATRVAITGATIVAGAPFTDDPGQTSGGSAWVFRRVGHAWVPIAKLKAPDVTPGDSFGAYVAIDKSTILIGAESADGPTGTFAGAAYVFNLNDD
jgi:hypothetical protein